MTRMQQLIGGGMLFFVAIFEVRSKALGALVPHL
jgi:hypothetical protein